MRSLRDSVLSCWRALAGRVKSSLESARINPDNLAWAWLTCIFVVGVLALIAMMLILVWFLSTAKPWTK